MIEHFPARNIVDASFNEVLQLYTKYVDTTHMGFAERVGARLYNAPLLQAFAKEQFKKWFMLCHLCL